MTIAVADDGEPVAGEWQVGAGLLAEMNSEERSADAGNDRNRRSSDKGIKKRRDRS